MSQLLTGVGGSSGPAGIADLWNEHDASTLDLADGATVDAFPASVGGAGHDLAIGAGTPTFQTNELNGLPAVRFDGASYLVSPAFAVLPQPYTTFLVAKWATNDSAFKAMLSAASQGNTFIQGGLADVVVAYAGVLDCTVTTTPGTPHIYTAKFQGATSIHRVDGTVLNAGADAGANGIDSIGLGANLGVGQFAVGDFFHTLTYSRILSDPECRVVELALGAKWGIAVA